MFEFLNAISDWFQQGIYTWFEETAKYLITTLMISYVKGQIWGLEFAWEVAQGVLTGLDMSGRINTALGALPSSVSSALSFFGVPSCISMLLSAGVTRLVLRFVPGL